MKPPAGNFGTPLRARHPRLAQKCSLLSDRGKRLKWGPRKCHYFIFGPRKYFIFIFIISIFVFIYFIFPFFISPGAPWADPVDPWMDAGDPLGGPRGPWMNPGDPLGGRTQGAPGRAPGAPWTDGPRPR